MLASSLAQDAPPTTSDHRRLRPWLRLLGLGVVFCALCVPVVWLREVTPADPNSTAPLDPFVHIWLLAFVPYAAASALVLFTRPAAGKWRWGEVSLILGGALVLRLFLLGLVPNLSHDAWRYVWDARAFLHGYSPYVTLPAAGELQPLRDFIYANSRFRNAPSIYPPGAQYLYALSYLLAPSNLFALKGVFLLFDMLNCLLVLRLLTRQKLDPARVLLYAWSPLPVVEFALEGHLDVVAMTFSLLAVLSAARLERRGRLLTGFLVGMGALVKIYPLVLLLPLVNIREWKRDVWLVLACGMTIVAGYLPFVVLGHGQVFGFFSTYANEQGQNAGLVQHIIWSWGSQLHLPPGQVIAWEHGVAVVLLAGMALTVMVARARERISLPACVLLLFGLVLAVSSHVFPW
ncbi:MAG TPA: glycosyltransferase 87 family protein, partial [Ktedonobacteraceae bacterium]|nr:glycosyltransferase 87 family protein [Ktedonobacteraceae bacterium]